MVISCYLWNIHVDVCDLHINAWNVQITPEFGFEYYSLDTKDHYLLSDKKVQKKKAVDALGVSPNSMAHIELIGGASSGGVIRNLSWYV